MTGRCPNGHDSSEADYCSVCGAAMGGPAPGPAAASGVACPVCGEPRAEPSARFCEVCRHDYAGPPPKAAPPAARAASPPPSAPARASNSGAKAPRWELVVTVDPSLDTEPDPESPAPAAAPERVFPVDVDEMLVGRRDDRRDIRPQVPVSDPGASRRHVLFVRAGGAVSLVDLASTNGTKLNGEEVVSGATRPLREGDEVTLGRWTRIRLRSRA